VLAVLLALTLLAVPTPAAEGPAEAPAPTAPRGAATGATPPPRAPQISPVPLPPPAPLGSPFARPAAGPVGKAPPGEVLALLAAGRTLVEARQADLDLDGSPEWLLVARFLNPDRLEQGPGSVEWRAGQRITTRINHELVVIGRVRRAWTVFLAVELRGNERQALLVEPVAGADGKPGRWPVVVTGARACLGPCGPVDLHLVSWDPVRRAPADHAWEGVQFALVAPGGPVEAWLADRRPGDPACCPSGYKVLELVVSGGAVEARRERSVPADRLRRLLRPGLLIERAGAGGTARSAAPR